jgi:hypothetical protein
MKLFIKLAALSAAALIMSGCECECIWDEGDSAVCTESSLSHSSELGVGLCGSHVAASSIEIHHTPLRDHAALDYNATLARSAPLLRYSADISNHTHIYYDDFARALSYDDINADIVVDSRFSNVNLALNASRKIELGEMDEVFPALGEESMSRLKATYTLTPSADAKMLFGAYATALVDAGVFDESQCVRDERAISCKSANNASGRMVEYSYQADIATAQVVFIKSVEPTNSLVIRLHKYLHEFGDFVFDKYAAFDETYYLVRHIGYSPGAAYALKEELKKQSEFELGREDADHYTFVSTDNDTYDTSGTYIRVDIVDRLAEDTTTMVKLDYKKGLLDMDGYNRVAGAIDPDESKAYSAQAAYTWRHQNGETSAWWIDRYYESLIATGLFDEENDCEITDDGNSKSWYCGKRTDDECDYEFTAEDSRDGGYIRFYRAYGYMP